MFSHALIWGGRETSNQTGSGASSLMQTSGKGRIPNGEGFFTQFIGGYAVIRREPDSRSEGYVWQGEITGVRGDDKGNVAFTFAWVAQDASLSAQSSGKWQMVANCPEYKINLHGCGIRMTDDGCAVVEVRDSCETAIFYWKEHVDADGKLTALDPGTIQIRGA